MTTHNPKTKRDRAAGRKHRHTALQTIIDNHETLTTDLAEFEGTVTQRMKDMRGNIGYSMGCIVETERKVAEIEPALALLQEFSRQQSSINVTAARVNELSCKTQKAQQDAIAQLNRYTTKLHAKQTNLKHDLAITRIDLEDMEKKFITLAWINLGIWVAAALTIFVLLIIVS